MTSLPADPPTPTSLTSKVPCQTSISEPATPPSSRSLIPNRLVSKVDAPQLSSAASSYVNSPQKPQSTRPETQDADDDEHPLDEMLLTYVL